MDINPQKPILSDQLFSAPKITEIKQNAFKPEVNLITSNEKEQIKASSFEAAELRTALEPNNKMLEEKNFDNASEALELNDYDEDNGFSI